MAHYRKGANAERELIHMLFEKGFSVVRTAGSGKTPLPAPDMVALKPEKQFAFECKAWSAANLALPIAQMDELVQWSKRAGVQPFVAWKVPRKGWFFLRPRQLHKTSKFWLISRKDAMRLGLSFDQLIA